MNESQAKFISLVNSFEALKDKLNEVGEQLTVSMQELKIDTYVQDPTTLLVYKIVKPSGTFVEYREIGYKRTAKEGERGGTVLAKKEAEEAGFVLKK